MSCMFCLGADHLETGETPWDFEDSQVSTQEGTQMEILPKKMPLIFYIGLAQGQLEALQAKMGIIRGKMFEEDFKKIQETLDRIAKMELENE